MMKIIETDVTIDLRDKSSLINKKINTTINRGEDLGINQKILYELWYGVYCLKYRQTNY